MPLPSGGGGLGRKNNYRARLRRPTVGIVVCARAFFMAGRGNQKNNSFVRYVVTDIIPTTRILKSVVFFLPDYSVHPIVLPHNL